MKAVCNLKQNNKGFTLIEMIIVIALIALSLTMVTFAGNLILQNNVKSYAEQYNSDLRAMKNDTMSSQGEEYFLQWHYDATEKQYYYDIYLKGSPSSVLKTVWISSSIEVDLDKTGSYNGLEAYVPDQVRIEFSPSTGKLIDVLDNNGGGVYRFLNPSTNTTATVSVIEETGRVFYDD